MPPPNNLSNSSLPVDKYNIFFLFSSCSVAVVNSIGTIFYASSIILSILAASVGHLINIRFLRGKKVTNSTELNPAFMS